MLPSRENCYNFEASLSHHLPKLKEVARQKVHTNYLDKWNSKVKDLVIQGDFLNMLISEQSDVSWKSIINGEPQGGYAICMRSCTNTLATLDNLKRWIIGRSDTCKMCLSSNSRPKKATLFQILNKCSAFLRECHKKSSICWSWRSQGEWSNNSTTHCSDLIPMWPCCHWQLHPTSHCLIVWAYYLFWTLGKYSCIKQK
jgi:hypothetical protein